MRIPQSLTVAVALVLALGCENHEVANPDDIDTVRGSCNAIFYASTCEDFVGSYWTEKNMRLQCSSNATFFLNQRCNYSYLGGCRNAPNTQFENVVWIYDTGGEPFTAEEAAFARTNCVNTGGIWVTRS